MISLNDKEISSIIYSVDFPGYELLISISYDVLYEFKKLDADSGENGNRFYIKTIESVEYRASELTDDEISKLILFNPDRYIDNKNEILKNFDNEFKLAVTDFDKREIEFYYDVVTNAFKEFEERIKDDSVKLILELNK